MKCLKSRSFVVSFAILAILASSLVVISATQTDRNIDHASQSDSRKRPAVVEKSKMVLEISKQLKLTPDQEDKFALSFSKHKEEFKNATKGKNLSQEQFSKELSKAWAKVLLDTKKFLSPEVQKKLKQLIDAKY